VQLVSFTSGVDGVHPCNRGGVGLDTIIAALIRAAIDITKGRLREASSRCVIDEAGDARHNRDTGGDLNLDSNRLGRIWNDGNGNEIVSGRII
jgi:hypothetical protein